MKSLHFSHILLNTAIVYKIVVAKCEQEQKWKLIYYNYKESGKDFDRTNFEPLMIKIIRF